MKARTLFFVILYKWLNFNVSRGEVISLAQGRIRGITREGYISYLGIPYANITEKNGQFKIAGLAPSWPDIRNSMQTECSWYSIAEECLQLDVHVPTEGGPPWPILAWVAGGGKYEPALLVREGVVAVIVYHRVGPQGFLCLGQERIPGNAGAKDVLLAIRWIRDNIVAFRGNPNKIVVAGQGFEAAIVEGLTLTSAAKELFHGAILQSGTILSPWAYNYDSKQRAQLLSFALSRDEDAEESLYNSDITDLVQQSEQLEISYFPFGLCTEEAFKNEECFLSEPPFDSLSNNRFTKLPMIIGYNKDEAYIFAKSIKSAGLRRKIQRDLKFLLPEELKALLRERELRQLSRDIKDKYFKRNVSIESIIKYHRDAYFLNHIYRSVHLHASAHPIYFYEFSHLGNEGVEQEDGIRKTGPAFGDELAYLFSFGGKKLEDKDGDAQERLVKLWTNFVKYLDPTPNGLEPTRWDPVEVTNPRLLSISTDLKMQTFHHQQLDIWEKVYEKFYTSRPDTE